MNKLGKGWFLTGFLALAFGNAIGAVYMFRGDVLLVMGGVFLMVSGYQVMHYGTHREGMVNFDAVHPAEETSRGLIRVWGQTVLLLLVSIYTISQGFVIGSQATQQAFTIIDMGLCGGLIVMGYVTGHMAIHGKVL